jgi:hypothetical protein
MSTLKAVFTNISVTAFIGLNVADLALIVFLLSWGGTEIAPIHCSFNAIQLLPATKMAFISFTLLALWNYQLLYLLRWINLVVAVVVAFNMSMVISQLI